MNAKKIVYHASPKQGLKILEPKESTFPDKLVYACEDKVMTAFFLGRTLGDFSCSIKRQSKTGLPAICERFNGGLELRYDHPASIYWLDGSTFYKRGGPYWREEVVSEKAVVPIKEEKITNAKDYLLELAKEGKIILARYPEKISGFKEDDEDLVDKAVKFIRMGKKDLLKEIKPYHPHLINRILKKLNETSNP